MSSTVDDPLFWSKVDKGDGDDCWLWRGALTKNGYGNLGRNKKNWYAHRYAWYLAFGALPENVLDHMCGVRNCVNIKHLRDVTQAVNVRTQKGLHGQNRSGARGVRWDARTGKWLVGFQRAGKIHHFGTFDLLEDAKRIAERAKAELYKEDEDLR